MSLTTSLIITTYNRPDALSAVIRTAIEQSILPNEVIVADDGSNEQTKQVPSPKAVDAKTICVATIVESTLP